MPEDIKLPGTEAYEGMLYALPTKNGRNMSETVDIVRYVAAQAGVRLPAPRAMEAEEAGMLWDALEQVEHRVGLGKGFLACNIVEKDGFDGLKKFAEDKKLSYNSLREHRLTYQRLINLNIDARASLEEAVGEGEVSFVHLRIAKALEDDDAYVAALKKAQKEKMPSRAFAEEVVSPLYKRQERLKRESAAEVEPEPEEVEAATDVGEGEVEPSEVVEESGDDGLGVSESQAVNVPSPTLSEAQKAAFDMPRILIALKKHDPAEVGAMHRTPARVRDEIRVVGEVVNWLERYEKVLEETLGPKAI